MAVGAVDLALSCRRLCPDRPAYSPLVSKAAAFAEASVARLRAANAAKPKNVWSLTLSRIWLLAGVVWRLSENSDAVCAAIVFETNDLIGPNSRDRIDQFEQMRHNFSKEVATPSWMTSTLIGGVANSNGRCCRSLMEGVADLVYQPEVYQSNSDPNPNPNLNRRQSNPTLNRRQHIWCLS